MVLPALRVLLIEDNPGDVRLIQAMLHERSDTAQTRLRIEPEVVDRLAAGVRQLAETPFDAVLLDLSLPDAEGLTCVLKIREAAPELPIVVLSGRDDLATALQAVHEGAQDFLLKGHVDAELLQRSLQYAIERKRLDLERGQLLESEREARQQAEVAVHIRDQILGTVSHDLRTPLATIAMFAQLLSEPQAAANIRLTEWASKIGAAVQEGLTMIDELVDVARLGMGEALELAREAIDLFALAEETIAEHQQRAAQHPIELIASTPRITGWWDRLRLKRVLENLLSNATKYSAPGSRVWVTISTEDDDGSWAILAVRDEGVGIPPDELGTIFEWYRRASNVGARRGTGIGLAGARRIVELHGGTITAVSAGGAGSTFTVRLPLHIDQA